MASSAEHSASSSEAAELSTRGMAVAEAAVIPVKGCEGRRTRIRSKQKEARGDALTERVLRFRKRAASFLRLLRAVLELVDDFLLRFFGSVSMSVFAAQKRARYLSWGKLQAKSQLFN